MQTSQINYKDLCSNLPQLKQVLEASIKILLYFVSVEILISDGCRAIVCSGSVDEMF